MSDIDAGAPAGEAPETGVESGAQGTENGNGAGLDTAALMARMDEVVGNTAQFMERIESRLPAGEPEGEQGQETFDPYDVMYGAGESGNEDPEAAEAAARSDAQRIHALAQQTARQIVDSEMGPIRAQLFEQQLDKFVQQYPAMGDEQVAKPIVAAAQAFANQHGLPNVSISLLETMYLADQARKQAGQEAPAGSNQEVPLEAGGGSLPGQPQVDPADAIVNAGRSSGAISQFL